jgi:hypothetical protein
MAPQGGTGVKVKITVGTTLTAIAYLKNVSGFPAQEKELAVNTAHPTSGTTVYETLIDTGLRRLTSFTCTLSWDDTNTTHAAILTAFNATSPVNMSIEDPAGGEVIAFSAHIRRVSRMGNIGTEYEAQVEIQPTGAPTIT